MTLRPTLKQIADAAENISGGISTNPEDMRDQLSELASLVRELAEHLNNIEQTANRAANVASCLANGIQPD